MYLSDLFLNVPVLESVGHVLLILFPIYYLLLQACQGRHKNLWKDLSGQTM